MDGLNTFAPIPVQLPLAGETLELTPIRLGELPRFLAVVHPVAEALVGEPDWIALLACHGETVLELLAISTRRDRAWINALSLDEAVRIAAAVFEVNADFFVHHVVPSIQQSAQRIAPILRLAGTTPSPA